MSIRVDVTDGWWLIDWMINQRPSAKQSKQEASKDRFPFNQAGLREEKADKQSKANTLPAFVDPMPIAPSVAMLIGDQVRSGRLRGSV
jgi:hypothetical protein